MGTKGKGRKTKGIFPGRLTLVKNHERVGNSKNMKMKWSTQQG